MLIYEGDLSYGVYHAYRLLYTDVLSRHNTKQITAQLWYGSFFLYKIGRIRSVFIRSVSDNS